MKRFLCLCMALLVAIGICFSAPMTIEVEAATNHTKQEAIEWIKARGNENWWKDVDGAYGCQCVDLIMAYYEYLVGYRVSGNAKDYLNESKLPSGWYIDTTPAPGAIIVWGAYTYTGQWTTGENGHVGLVYNVSSSNVYTVETNTGSTNGQGTAAGAKFRTRVNVGAKYIHPDFSGTTPTPPALNPATITEGEYYIKRKGGSYLSVAYASDTNGADVCEYDKSYDFRVKIKSNSNGYEMWFPGVSSTRVVNQYGSAPSAGAEIDLWTHSGSTSQSWIFQKYSDGYLIRSKYNTNLFFTGNGSGVATLETFTGADNQIWYLESLQSPPAAPVVKMSKTSFAVGESVTISWNSVSGATSYWISAWRSSDHVINEASTSLSKKVSFSTAGNYSVAVTARDAYGQETLSEWVYFTVYKPYTVTFNANGGTGGPTSQIKKSTEDLILSSSKPTRTGYTFLGWGTSTGDTTVNYAPGATYSTNENKTLYAIWEPNVYTLTYNANGGSNPPASQTKTHGTNLTLSTAKPTRTGYTFLGWGTSTGDTSVNYAPGATYSTNENKTLYAIWQCNHTSDTTSVNAKSATCTSTGYTGDTYCSTCETTISKGTTIAKTAHKTTVVNAKSATCTSTGYTGDTKCTVCGTVTAKGTTIAKVAHKTSIVGTKDATANETGYTGDKVCSVCNIVTEQGKEIPKLTVTLATPSVKIANTSKGIKVNWNAIENAESYIVYRRVYNASTKKWSGWSRLKTGVTSTSYTDKTVKLGTNYRYTVRAVNGDVMSKYTSTSTLKYNVTPTVKIADASNGIKVSWSTAANATGYTVYRSQYDTKTKKWTSWKNMGTAKSNKTSWTDKKVKSGVKYKYTVRACNGKFKSNYKASANLLYLAQPKVTVKAVTNGINVAWTQCSGATGYTVYRSEYNTKTKKWSGWKKMGTAKSNKKAWTDKSAKKGVTYKYTVRAVNGKVKSSYAASGSVKR